MFGTNVSIKGGAFDNCISVTNVVIGGNDTRLGNYLFAGCTNLTSVCFEGNFPTNFFGADVFVSDPVEFIFYAAGATGWGSSVENIPTVSCGQCSAGALQVNLTPAGAVNAGAEWQVDGGASCGQPIMVPRTSPLQWSAACHPAR